MDKKYLDKVVNKLVDETTIEDGVIKTPFNRPFAKISIINFLRHRPPDLFYTKFTEHCVLVYGLADEEVYYVWKEYKDIILDKIWGNK